MNVRVLVFAILCLLPASASAFNISFDYSHHRDWHVDRGVIKSNTVAVKAANKPRENLEYYAHKLYGKTDDITTKDNGGFGIGYDPILNEKWSLWFDGNWSYDKALGIDSEIFFGAGPKLYLYKKGSRKASVSFGILHQSREPGDYIDQRWSWRVKGSTENWKASAFYQPNIDNSADYIASGEIEGKISEGAYCFWNTKYRALDGSQITAMGLRFKYSAGGKDA